MGNLTRVFIDNNLGSNRAYLRELCRGAAAAEQDLERGSFHRCHRRSGVDPYHGPRRMYGRIRGIRVTHGSKTLERGLDKSEQLRRRWIAGYAQVAIKPDVIGSRGPEDFRRHSRFPEFAPQPVRLGGSVGMVGHMQNQERRNSLVARDVPDGGEVALAIGGTELLRMPQLRVRLAEALAARRGGSDL